MSPLEGDAMPRPKSAQLARGQRRYRRKVASPKQWVALAAAKAGPCRVCVNVPTNGHDHGRVGFHHVVPRSAPWFGDDVAENLVPAHDDCHGRVHNRDAEACAALLASLADDEYAYAVEKGGEAFFERAYGLGYGR